MPREPCFPCERRRLLGAMAAALALPAGLARAALDPGPSPGDWLVPVDQPAAGPLVPASLGETPRVVLALDASTGRVRDASPLHRIVLIRLAPAVMDEPTRARAADGVLAYSASCTHGACSVHEWRPKTRRLLCPCHFSQFDPARGAAVTAGPAPRPLPHLPLRLDGGRLQLAGGFSERPGPD